VSDPVRAACTVCEVHAESVFRIEGMDCSEEVTVLERRLEPMAGVESISADLIGQRLRVQHDAARLSASDLVAAVAQTGMKAWLEHEEGVGARSTDTARQALVVLSGALLASGLALRLLGFPWLSIGACTGSILAGGIYTVRRAWSAARSFTLDINVLMLVAVAGAMAIGEWTEGATVVFLFSFAQWLELRSMDRARRAIRTLMDLAPLRARVKRAGGEATVPVEAVGVGEIVLVAPGEKVPLDGTVLAGESAVNQAPITGESLPVDKTPGDTVFAGTINGHGALDIRITRLGRDSTLARIIGLVESAQAQKAPAQTFVERFARVYTPAVIVLAAIVATAVPLALAQPFTPWIYRALVLLVIACPCALVISTPVSVVSALAAAARRGVLVKGGRHLERTGAIRCVAFDKTGTLTAGIPEVVDVIPLARATAAEVMRLAASLEARSEHPIGKAIAAHAKTEGIETAPVDRFKALPGRGAEAEVDAGPACIGNHRLFEERKLCTPEIHEHLDAMAGASRTAVLVARGREAVGIIGVADRLRANGRDAIDLLRRQGVERLVLLTGDNRVTGEAVRRDFGLDECRAELLPEDKVTSIVELRRQYGTVAMVGDGVNDAPALAAADVGIAMGAAASDAALETADVALMADELLKIPYAVRLGRSTVANIRTNIAVALGLKAVFLLLAVGGVATLWMAVVADMGASLLVIGNGLRLLRTA
jgi:Cd2+/Zn2+-exporting ATPase